MPGDLDLGEVDVIEFLRMLDVENVTDDGKEARFSCPYPAHGMGDRNPSAYMNMNSTAWTCFGCGAQGNAITFLADVKEVHRLTAKEWIAQKWAPHYANIENLREYAEQIFSRSEEIVLPEPFVPLDESIIGAGAIQHGHWNLPIRPAEDYFLHRGFTPEILERFEVVYDAYRDRPAITVRSLDGGLVGFKGRAWREDQSPKYLVSGDTPAMIADGRTPYGFGPYDASKFLFAGHLAQPIDGRLILREGELNVISMHQKGHTNTVGPSGSTLSDDVIMQIIDLCDEVVIFFDYDLATYDSAMTAKIKILKCIKAFEPYIDVRVVSEHEGDPAEMDKDQIDHLIATAKSSTLYQAEELLRAVGDLCILTTSRVHCLKKRSFKENNMPKGFAGAKKAGEFKGGGGFEQRPKGITYFKLDAGQDAIVRFLEPHDAIEWAAKWKLPPNNKFKYGELINKIDQLENGTPDPGYAAGFTSAFKAYPTMIWRGAPQWKKDPSGKLLKDGMGNKQFDGNRDSVAVWECSFEVFNMLAELEVQYRSITRLDWKIKRVGGGTDTKYMIMPADPLNIDVPLSGMDQQLVAAQRIDASQFTKIPTFEALQTYINGGVSEEPTPSFGQQAVNNAAPGGGNPFLA